AVGDDLPDDLLWVAALVGHVQAVGGEVAEAAPVVAAAGGVDAGGGQERPAVEQVAPRRRGVAVRLAVGPGVRPLQRAALDVAEDLRPHLRPLAEYQLVGVRGVLLRAR